MSLVNKALFVSFRIHPSSYTHKILLNIIITSMEGKNFTFAGKHRLALILRVNFS